MFGKKYMIFLSMLFCGMTADLNSWWESQRVEQVQELPHKPRFFQQGMYKHGRYTQFTVDTAGFFAGIAAGVTARTLVSFAQCGNKFESFKSSVFRPGCIKSALFWIPSIVAYRFVLSSKNNADLVRKLEQYEGQFDPMKRLKDGERD